MKEARSFLFPAMLFAGFFISFWLGVSAPAHAAATIWHTGDYHVTANTVWQTGEVHAISNGAILWIDPGATLTINPGVVVKVGSNAVIRVNGNLSALGTADKLIYFTSLYDDAVAGDTNGDGAATSPGLGDWRGFDIDGSRYNSVVSAEFNYAVISYGGRGQPRGLVFNVSKAASFKVDSCNIINNLGSIFIDYYSNNISINNSNLYNPDFCDYASSTDACHANSGLKSFSSKTLDLQNNYWGSSGGPTYTTGTEPRIYKGVVLANLVGANMVYQPFADKPFEFGVKKVNPVIIIPGILGSWQDWNGVWQMDPILHTYDDLLEALRLAGYKDNETLFTFPYQWRQSNVITAQQLKDKIEAVKLACRGEGIDCSKVDLVGHSMGGIVARTYIEGDNYGNDVDQMIFIATPHKGAPKAYLMWEGGEVGKAKLDSITKQILFLEALENGYTGDGALSRYIKEKQIYSVKELLPIYNYLFDYDGLSGNLRYYPNNYPRNELLETLNSSEKLDKLKSIRVLNIIGDTNLNTLNALYLTDSSKPNLWENGMPYDFYGDYSKGLFYGEGDGTVPNISNSGFVGLSDLIISTDHSSVVSYAQKDVIKELLGKEPTVEIHNFRVPNLLLVAMHSPADFVITAPDGKHLGRNLTDTSSATPLNEIPNAFYSGFNLPGIAEFAVIPNPLPGEYQVAIKGTGAGGAYSVSADFIGEAASTSTIFEGQILPEQTRNITIVFNTTTNSFTSVQADITLDSAISDVNTIYDQGLLTGANNKKKIIQQYEWLRLKIKVADQLIALAVKAREKLNSNTALPADIKDKLIRLADEEINKLRQTRLLMLTDFFADLDKYLNKLAANGFLKPLGYGIIKANNDYLTNNL